MKKPIEVRGAKKVDGNLRLTTEEIRKRKAAGIRKGGILIEREVKENQLSGQTLDVGSGSLRASFGSKFVDRGERATSVVGSQLVYASIHETGGIIEAHNPSGLLTFKIGEDWIRVPFVVMPERRYVSKAVEAKKQEVIDLVGSEISIGLKRRAG